MENPTYSDIVSTLAFITALGALAWNIVRDFISDLTSIQLRVAFGERGNINNSSTALFADAGSLLPEHKFTNLGIMYQIINTGNKTVVIKNLEGSYKSKKKEFSIVIHGLPKKLEPYEIFTTTVEINNNLLELISNSEVKNIWVTDTKDKKWYLSKKEWKRLKFTADYIKTNKNI